LEKFFEAPDNFLAQLSSVNLN